MEAAPNVIGVSPKFTALQLRAIRRAKRTKVPESLTIKHKNLKDGDIIYISSEDEKKYLKALNNKTGVRVLFDIDQQMTPALDWIASSYGMKPKAKTQYSKFKGVSKKMPKGIKGASAPAGKGFFGKDTRQKKFKKIMLGRGGVLPYPKGRGTADVPSAETSTVLQKSLKEGAALSKHNALVRKALQEGADRSKVNRTMNLINAVRAVIGKGTIGAKAPIRTQLNNQVTRTPAPSRFRTLPSNRLQQLMGQLSKK